MRRLTYYVATTLDGFIAGPDGGDPSGESYFPIPPDLVDHIARCFPETLPAPARAAMGLTGPGEVFDTVLEGSASYQVGVDAGVDDAYPHLQHLVFSTTRPQPSGTAIEMVRSHALERVRQLKGDGSELDIWLVGGGRLARSLLPEIDRVVLKQHPAVIGSGIPLFAGPVPPTTFVPVEATLLDSGVRILTFDRA